MLYNYFVKEPTVANKTKYKKMDEFFANETKYKKMEEFVANINKTKCKKME